MNHEIYADHAATAPIEPLALEAMYTAYQEYANPAALYRSALHTKQTVEKARLTVAENLGCTPDHIFFTSGGSESNTWAIRGTVPQGGHVVTTPIEHHSVLNACASIRDDGGRMTTLEVDGFGRVVPESLTRALAAHPNLVSLQYANNEVGVVQNIPALAALCREADVLLHVDAVQAAGHLAIPLDGIDFLSASAHKFGGPKGIGFLYVREPRKLRPLIYGGSQQYGLRPGTEPAALIAGLAAAFKVTCAERRQRTAKKRALAEEFWQTLHAARPEARLHTPVDGLPGLLSVGLPGRSGQRLTYQLDVAGVNVSPGAACDNRGVQEPSHVLMALGGTAAEDALSTLRFSFGSANRPADGHCTIEGGSEVGVLYGVFALLRNLQTAGKAWAQFTADEEKAPSNRLRMLNHWDNMDGSIERGYSGDSFFFKDSEILIDVPRLTAYARMLASVGINGITINNVNVKDAASWLITDRYFGALQEYLKIFTPYGVKLYLSINFAAPMELGGMDSADPCDPAVAKWWADKAQEVWANLPGLGGFLVKADSEGRPGPFTYGRNQADGANMLADAVAPCGGHIVWRCFVYNCQQDWRNTKIDRARAGYDYFMPLDGTFRDNVTLQIKNGPMDFQVREPVSPLIGGLQHTHIAVEFQIAQEYTGQQRHVCYLMPWFRQILDFDMHTRPNGDAHVRALIQGAGNGMVAVTNTGNDENWTGHDLAAANLYGFGRLSYDTTLDPAVIAGEWLRLTFGNNEPVEKTLHRILMQSWPTYEKYNAPLGVGWMVNPNYHYGPNVDGYEYSRWGCYHRASFDGIGIDRSPTGSDYCHQYAPELAEMYANVETCPEELLLFFHHMPFNYVLKRGQTILQHIYDTHFAGAADAARFYDEVVTLKPYLDPAVYARLEARFAHQKEHACEWRDVINTYFYRKTGIGDAHGRKIYE